MDVDVEKDEPNRGRMAISLPARAARVRKMIEVETSTPKISGCRVRAARQEKGETDRRVRTQQNKTQRAWAKGTEHLPIPLMSMLEVDSMATVGTKAD